MGIRSYAGNHEDVLLHRALGGVDRGFYIDVGAGDPVVNSVTRAFYGMGWSGINVEPLRHRYERLVRQRSRDINLHAACSDKEATVPFFTVEAYDELSSLLAEAVKVSVGGKVVENSVESRTLASICYELVSCDIHFLKVDVEGSEGLVLAGADFEQFRPWVILIEVVSPYSTPSDEASMIEVLRAARYRPAFFDGVNRFFIAEERYDELSPAFSYPVCVLDDYVDAEVRTATALGDMAQKLGASSLTDEHEIGARLDALITDRLMFEHKYEEANRALDTLRSERQQADLALHDLVSEHQSAVLALEEQQQIVVEALTIERDCLLFRSFERERYLAAQRNEVARLGREMDMRVGRIHELEVSINQTQAVLDAAQVEISHLRHQYEAVLASTSWTISRPLRVLRRPRHYLMHYLRRKRTD